MAPPVGFAGFVAAQVVQVCFRIVIAVLLHDVFQPDFPPAAYQRLARMGHNVKCDLDSATFGRGEMILRTEQGTLVGATEPRADGCVAAW